MQIKCTIIPDMSGLNLKDVLPIQIEDGGDVARFAFDALGVLVGVNGQPVEGAAIIAFGEVTHYLHHQLTDLLDGPENTPTATKPKAKK